MFYVKYTTNRSVQDILLSIVNDLIGSIEYKNTLYLTMENLQGFMLDTNCLRGYCTPNLKLACFVCYLKMINLFFLKKVCILKKIVQGTQKWY